jgi:hypothetical protein
MGQNLDQVTTDSFQIIHHPTIRRYRATHSGVNPTPNRIPWQALVSRVQHAGFRHNSSFYTVPLWHIALCVNCEPDDNWSPRF